MPQLVGDAGDERRLRADDDEVGGKRPRKSEQPSPSSAATGWHVAREAIPGFPGAACSSVSSGDDASRQASACSRPPDPTRRTRTARVYELDLSDLPSDH